MPEDFHDPFEVGECVVEPRLNRISRGSEHHTVRPQAMDLLVYLALRKGQVVSSDKLMDDLWHGVTVGSGSVYNCINELRRAFGDSKKAPKFIETIPKRGYRLIAPTAGIAAPEAAGADVEEASIAVLPFVNLSSDPEQEYFSDGITEELLNSLAGVEGLQVAARVSSFYFRDNRPSAREIGVILGVGHILEGSVRRTGNRIRITAQLIDADSGFHLWSQTYDRELGDIFALQDEISVAIVDALRDRLGLGPGEIGNPRASKAVNPEAYSEYLLGRHQMNQRTGEAFRAAIRHLESSIELDRNYAPAYAIWQ